MLSDCVRSKSGGTADSFIRPELISVNSGLFYRTAAVWKVFCHTKAAVNRNGGENEIIGNVSRMYFKPDF